MKRIMSLLLCLCLLAGCHKKSKNENDELKLYFHNNYAYRVPYTWSETETDNGEPTWLYYHGHGMLSITISNNTNNDYTSSILQKQLIRKFESHAFFSNVSVNKDITGLHYDSIKGFRVSFRASVDDNQYNGYFAGTLYDHDNIIVMLLYNDKETDYAALLNDIIQSITPYQLPESEEIPDDDTATSEQDDEPATQDDQTEEESEPDTSTGIDPEFKKIVDDYESFVNEYIDFLLNVDQVDDTYYAITQILSYSNRLTTESKKYNSIDVTQLNEEEYAYYVAANARISKRVLELDQ